MPCSVPCGTASMVGGEGGCGGGGGGGGGEKDSIVIRASKLFVFFFKKKKKGIKEKAGLYASLFIRKKIFVRVEN